MYDTHREERAPLDWKLGTHLILGYFLCCCIVTAPKDGEGDWERKTKGKRKERAEVVVI